MIKRLSKRALSLILALVLVVTTFFIFDPDLLRVESDAYVDVESAETSAFLSSQVAYASETIYLKPGSTAFDYFENYNYNTGAVNGAKDRMGSIYFKNDDAAEVVVAVNKVYKKGGSAVATGKLTVNSTTVNAYAGLSNGADERAATKFNAATKVATASSGTLEYNITSGSFTAHTDYTTEGIYFVEWVFRYKIGDVYHYAFAYTGIYSTSLAQAGITYNGKRVPTTGSRPYQMGYTFITGAMKYGGGNAKSNFINSNVINVSGKTNVDGSYTSTLTAPLISFVGLANNSSNYTVPGNNQVGNGAMQTNKTYFPDATNGGVYRIPDNHQRENEYASFHTTKWDSYGSYDNPNPVGATHDIGYNISGVSTGVAYIVVDTSRYTNYNQLPYLQAGWAQFMHHMDGKCNYLDYITGMQPDKDNPTALSDPITTSVDRGDWESSKDDDGRSFTRGLYHFNGNVRAGMVAIYFQMINGWSGLGSASVNIRTNVGLHTTTINQNLLRQHYNSALNTFVDYQNISKYIADKAGDYTTYYNTLKLVGEELCDPTAHTHSSYKSLETLSSELVSAISKKAAPAVYFYVPETIYVDPRANSSKYNFKYYVDCTVDSNGNRTLTAAGEDTIGNVYLSGSTVDRVISVVGSVKTYPGKAANGSVSLASSISASGTLDTTIDSSSSYINSYEDSMIEWTATYSTKEGQTLTTTAYSWVYGVPLWQTNQSSVVSASAQAGYDAGSHTDTNIGVTGWLVGAHKVIANAYTISSSTAGTSNTGSAGDGYGGYKNNYIENNGYVPTNGRDNIQDLYNTAYIGGSGFYYKNDNVNWETGGAGSITVDSSRYDNLGGIPYLYIGIDCNIRHEKSGNMKLRYDWYSTNPTKQPTSNPISQDGISTGNTQRGKKITGAGISKNKTKDTLVLNAWSQSYGNKTRTAQATFYLVCNFRNKEKLRDAYETALKKTLYLQEAYFKPNEWTEYERLFEDVSAKLMDPECETSQADMDSSANALLNQVARMEAAVTAPKGSNSYSYTKVDGSTVTVSDRSSVLNKGTATVYHMYYDPATGQYGDLNASVNGTNSETATFYFGETVSTGYNETQGYNYFGYYRSNAQNGKWNGTADLKGDIAGQGTYGKSGHNVDKFYASTYLTYTYVYTRATAGVYFDLGEAENAFAKDENNVVNLNNATIYGDFTGDDTVGGNVHYTVTSKNSLDFDVDRVGYNTRVVNGGFKNLFNFGTFSWSSTNAGTTTVDVTNQSIKMTANAGSTDTYAPTAWTNNPGTMKITPGHRYRIMYDYVNNSDVTINLRAFWFTGSTVTCDDWSASFGEDNKSVAARASGTHSYEFTAASGRNYLSLRLGITTGGASFTASNIRVIDLDDTTQYAKMNDIFIQNAATGLEPGQTYTIAFESSLRFDEMRWYAQDMEGNYTPTEDWSHEKGTIQPFFSSTNSDGTDTMVNYTAPVRVTTAVSKGGTVGQFTVPEGCKNINLGFCITSDEPLAGRIENIRIVKGDFVETDHTDKTYTIPTPVREGYSFTGWSEYDSPFDGVLSGNNYTFGEDSDTILASWEINKYDVTFDNEFDFDNGKWPAPNASYGSITDQDSKENTLSLKIKSDATGSDLNTLHPDVMELVEGHTYKVKIKYHVDNDVTNGRMQLHIFNYPSVDYANRNVWQTANGGGGFNNALVYINDNGSTGEISTTLTVPAGQPYARIRLGICSENSNIPYNYAVSFSDIYIQDITRGNIVDTTVSEPLVNTSTVVHGVVVPYKSTVGSAEQLANGLPTMTSSNFDFSGWYTDKNYTTQVKTTDVVQGRTYDTYSKWTVHLGYNADGGAYKDTAQTPPTQSGKAIGSTVTIDDYVPYKPGYNFGGWIANSADTTVNGQVYLPGASITLNANVTLKAKWVDATTAALDTEYKIGSFYPGQVYFYKYVPTGSNQYVSGYTYYSEDLNTEAYLFEGTTQKLYNDTRAYTYGVAGMGANDAMVSGGLTSGTTYYYGVGLKTDTQASTGTSFKLSQHTINYTYDANGGTVTGSGVTGYYNTNTSLETPIYPGHSLAGWLNTAVTQVHTGGFVPAAINSSIITGNTASFVTTVSLVAEWSVNSYTVSAYAYYNTAASATTVNTTYANGTVGGTVEIMESSMGAGASSSAEIVYKTNSNLVAVPATGYTFAGWYLNPTFSNGSITSWGTQVASTSPSMTITVQDSDYTAYAKFEINQYALSVFAYNNTAADLNTFTKSTVGGTVGFSSAAIGSEETVTYVHGQNYTMYAKPSAGYTFAGWYYGENDLGGNPSYTTTQCTYADGIYSITREATDSRSYKAKFIVQKYTVYVDANGGTLVNNNESYEAYAGATVQLNAPEKFGYQFSRWDLTSEAGGDPFGKIDNETGIYTFGGGNDSLKAVWEIAEFPIVIDPNGGKVASVDYYTGGGSDAGINKVEKDITTATTLLMAYNTQASIAEPVRTGYTFLGWKVTGTGTTGTLIQGQPGIASRYTVAFNDTAVITAQWQVISYTLQAEAYSNTAAADQQFQHNAVGGTVQIGQSGTPGATVAENIEYGTTRELIATPATGYYFEGWQNGVPTSVGALDIFSEEAAMTIEPMGAANRVYYAVFRIKSYNVTVSQAFNSVANVNTYTEGETGGTAAGGGTVNHGLTTPVTASEKTGYRFEGWFTSLDSTTPVSVANPYTPVVTENTHLIAKFGLRKYTVTVTTKANSSGAPTSFSEASGCGTIVGAGDYYFETYATLTATAAEGYTFLGWYRDADLTDLIGTDATISVFVSSTSAYYAKFSVNTSDATVSAMTVDADGAITASNAGGDVSLDNERYSQTQTGTYFFKGQYTVYAKAHTGYSFEGWYRNAALTIPAEDNMFDAGGYDSAKGYNYRTFHKNVDGSEEVYAKFVVGKYGLDVWAYSNSGAVVDKYLNNTVGGSVSITETNYTTDVTGNGSQKATASVFHGHTSTVSAAVKVGYTFEGWYSNDSFSDESFLSAEPTYTTATMTDDGLSIYAKFEIGKFTIIFDANGGVSGSLTEGTAYYDTAFEIKPEYTPDRTGWTFSGWAIAPTNTSGTYGTGVSIHKDDINIWYSMSKETGSFKLYAIWSQDSYGITVSSAYSTLTSAGAYYSGTVGGTVELVDIESITDSGEYILPLGAAIAPHLDIQPATGYLFNQWRYSLTSNPPETFSTINSWGTQGSDAVTMPNKSIKIVVFFIVGEFDVTAYAYSNSSTDLTTYRNNASGGTVKFGQNGASGTTAKDAGQYTQTVLAIATPAKGFAFAGWYRYNLQSVGTAPEDAFLIDKVFIQGETDLRAQVDDNKYNDKINVYFAVFTIQQYNATISARTYTQGQNEATGFGNPSINGGNVGIGLTAPKADGVTDDSWTWLETTQNEKSISVYYGVRVYYLAVPETGYEFRGWYNAKDAEYYGENLVEEFEPSYSRIMRDSDYYMQAKFVPYNFNLTLNENQGTPGNPSEIVVTYGNSFKIESTSIPLRVGYAFAGWSDTADGAVNEAYSKTITPAIIDTWFAACGANGTYTIYAVWQTAMVNILLDNQGAGNETSVQVQYGSYLPALEQIPEYAGFVFGGYYELPGGEGTQYYKANGTSDLQWQYKTDGTLYALWKTPVLKDITYENGIWTYNYETKEGTIAVTTDKPFETAEEITANAPADAEWSSSVEPVEKVHIKNQHEIATDINLNHYSQEALSKILNAVTNTDTDVELDKMTQPEINAYVATMAEKMELSLDENSKKTENIKPSITIYENAENLNKIVGQTITDKKDSANGSTYSKPMSMESGNYLYANKYSYSTKDAVDYYIYTNSKSPVIALEIDDGTVARNVADNKSSYPTKATIVDNSADKAYIDSSKKTYMESAVKAIDDINKAWFDAYLDAGIGTGYDYNAKSVIYLTPEFTSSGVENEIVYTITPSDNAYVENKGAGSAGISGDNTDMSRDYLSYRYEPTNKDSITVCICYHNSMNGTSDEGTAGGTGDYMQMVMDQVQDDSWLNQLHLLRTSGGIKNHEFPTTAENVYPVEDATYPYTTVGCTLGSFMYVFDSTYEPDATALAAAGDYSGAKDMIIKSIRLKGNQAKAAISSKSNEFNINHPDAGGLGYAQISSWSVNFYPKEGSYVYAHLVDRWGNVFNKVWKCYNVDQFASTINGAGSAATYNIFEDGGSNINSITLDGANVEFILDSTSTYEDGALTTTGNTVTLSTGVANKKYSLTVEDNATNKTTATVTTDSNGMLILNIDDARANLANGAYTFSLNGETVNLYSGKASIVRDASITPVSLSGSQTIVTVKTSSDAVKVQLVEGTMTRTVAVDSPNVTVVKNADGTLTWTIRFVASTGKHEYGVRGRTFAGWEDVSFTLSTEVVEKSVTDAIALKSVFDAQADVGERPVLNARTQVGTQKLQVVYPNGMTKTFDRNDDIIITTVGDVETWALSLSPYNASGKYELTVVAKYENKWQTEFSKSATVTVTSVAEEDPVIYSVKGADTVKVGDYVTFEVLTNAATTKIRFNYFNTTKTFIPSNSTVVENADGTKLWTVQVRFYDLGENEVDFSARSAANASWTMGEVFGEVLVTE